MNGPFAMAVDRRAFLASALGLAASTAMPTLGFAAEGDYPNKPVRIVSPYTAGGLGDTLPRALSNFLADRMKQPVVIDNKPGASQVIGVQAVQRADPDGYTLLWASTTSMAINPTAQKKLPYDPLKDFAPIGVCFTSPLYLVVRPNLPVKNVQELIAYAKAHPGKLTFASGGNGSTNHLAGELFKQQTGADMLHVPYKGVAGGITDLMAGNVDLMFEGNGIEYARNGQLRALAVASLKRVHTAPELPTVAESGVPGFEVGVWFGLMAPAAVRPEVVKRLVADLKSSLSDPSLPGKLPDTEITPTTPEQMTALIKADTAKWRDVITKANIVFD